MGLALALTTTNWLSLWHIRFPLSTSMDSCTMSTGAFKVASRLASATPPPARVLSCGIGWQGIGILFNGRFGIVTGSTVSVENVGLL
ncbi:nucleobase-ascorbate transporter 2-like [Camellia sinensis]|uniref:nucleobase-ascorbate transporter 2-like n=1 Tax=Camellia sinensis TaxID=4442 RepID=UPI0010361041|nr:nucleobase-ascorbate transporter 2-like [Camellia sinensis]